MNIAFLEAVQSHGGARKSTLELAERLIKKNHSCHIIDFWGTCDEFLEDVEKKQLPLKILNPRKSPIIINSSKNLIKVAGNILELFNEQRSLRVALEKYVTENNIDLVVVNNYKTLSILRKTGKYKIVYFARGWFNLNSIPKLKKIAYKTKVDYFFAVSQSTKQAIYSGGFAKLNEIFVVPNAIDLQKVEKYKLVNTFNRVGNTIRILHCGGFMEEKGQRITLELARKLKEFGLNFELTIVGSVYDGQESIKFLDEIKDLIVKMRISEYVKLIVNSQDPYKYFNECDIVIHPSFTEGLPRVIMEALAFKKIVLVNPVGGVTDFILNNFTGYLTDFNDVNDYYNLIIKIVSEPSNTNTIANNGYELLKANYTPEQQTARLEEVFSKL